MQSAEVLQSNKILYMLFYIFTIREIYQTVKTARTELVLYFPKDKCVLFCYIFSSVFNCLSEVQVRMSEIWTR